MCNFMKYRCSVEWLINQSPFADLDGASGRFGETKHSSVCALVEFAEILDIEIYFQKILREILYIEIRARKSFMAQRALTVVTPSEPAKDVRRQQLSRLNRGRCRSALREISVQ